METDYARSGTKAKEDVVLAEGPLKQFSHAIEPHLRSLGMPTQLKKGIVTLLQEFTVCKKGKILTPQQANILVSIVFQEKLMNEYVFFIFFLNRNYWKCLWLNSKLK